MRGVLAAPTEQFYAWGRARCLPPRLGSPATHVDGCDRAPPASPIGRFRLQRDTRAEVQRVSHLKGLQLVGSASAGDLPGV